MIGASYSFSLSTWAPRVADLVSNLSLTRVHLYSFNSSFSNTNCNMVQWLRRGIWKMLSMVVGSNHARTRFVFLFSNFTYFQYFFYFSNYSIFSIHFNSFSQFYFCTIKLPKNYFFLHFYSKNLYLI